jgi:hypothetical protein
MGGNLSCPSGFNQRALSCVAVCPADKGYEYRTLDGSLRCVYKADTKYNVALNPLLAIQNQPNAPRITTMEQLKAVFPDIHAKYQAEAVRFNNEFSVVDGNIDKDKKIAEAFRKLQEAENTRDVAPQAYQAARIEYYTLLKGQGWLEEERRRIARTEVDPVVNAYMNRYTDVRDRLKQQTKTIDIVNAVKDNLLDIQDEFGNVVGVFRKQLNEVKNQINIERTKKTEEVSSIWNFVGIALNILIVAALVFAIFSVGRTLLLKSRSQGVYTPQTSVNQ